MMSQNDACVLRWSCEVSNMTSNWSTESRRRFSLNSKFRTLNTQTACLLSHVWLNTKCPRRRTRRRTRRRKSECRSSSRRRGSVGGWESQGWIFYSSMEPSCGCSLMCVIIQCVTHASLLNIQHSTGSDVTSVTHSETTETENLVSFRDKHHFCCSHLKSTRSDMKLKHHANDYMTVVYCYCLWLPAASLYFQVFSVICVSRVRSIRTR